MKCKQPHFVVFRLMNEFYHASLAYILKLSLSVFILFARSFIRIEAIEIHSLFPWSLAKASGKQDKCEIDLIMLVSKTECYANIAPKMTEIILCASRHIRRMQSIHIILRQIERRQWISIPKIAAIRMLFNINDMFAFHTTFETNFRDSSSLSGQVIWNSMPGSCHPFISCHLKLHYIFPIACDRGIKYRYFCMLPVSVGQIYSNARNRCQCIAHSIYCWALGKTRVGKIMRCASHSARKHLTKYKKRCLFSSSW